MCSRPFEFPSQRYLDHSHCLVLAPATLAALPSTQISSPPVQLLQYLSFLPAIFRGLLQKLRLALRGASFAPPPQSSGLRSNRHCLFRCVLLPVLSWGRVRNHPRSGSFCSSRGYPIIRRVDRLQVTNRLPASAFRLKPPLQKLDLKCSSQAR